MTHPERPRLTFFFPAYNEEENVDETVRRALDEIGPLVGGSIEVLVVDDGSTDRTPQLADALAAADPRVRVHHQPNRGYGGALRAGFENARGELIGFSDGDLQFDLREFSRLLERLDDPQRGRFDVYRGEQIGPGRVSYALAFRFQPAGAGEEKAVEKALNKVRGALRHHLGADIR